MDSTQRTATLSEYGRSIAAHLRKLEPLRPWTFGEPTDSVHLRNAGKARIYLEFDMSYTIKATRKCDGEVQTFMALQRSNTKPPFMPCETEAQALDAVAYFNSYNEMWDYTLVQSAPVREVRFGISPSQVSRIKSGKRRKVNFKRIRAIVKQGKAVVARLEAKQTPRRTK